MRVSKLAFLLVTVMLLLPAIASAAPGTGIFGTAHDFSGAGPSGTIGLCTFCHTPHKALSTLLLWNHTLSKNNFTWAPVTETSGGTTFPTFKGDTYTGVSAKCLSCHDGSVAIGDVVLFRENWTGDGSGVILDPTTHKAGELFNVGAGGDMTGNHPVAMPYPFNNAKSTYNGVTTGARVALTEWQKDPTTFDVRLFNGNGVATPATGDAGMECSSCHDPHNGATVKDDLFVRGFLGGSDTTYICLKCHIK